MTKRTRRQTNVDRCPKCKVNNNICFCDEITSLPNKAPVHIIMHARERKLPSNTATLATHVLDDCKIHLRGLKDHELELSGLFDDNYQYLFLYPDDEAVELNEEFVKSFKKPIALVVPDGSWRQARKFKQREKVLQSMPSVKLPFTGPSEYKIRKSPYPEAVCTYEAIARALGVVENKNLQYHMERIFRIMVARFLSARYGRPKVDEIDLNLT